MPEIREELDSLIAAARAEGAEQVEKEKVAKWVAIHKEFPNLPNWTEVERLREKMFSGATCTDNVNALCAAVAADERERIRGQSELQECDDSVMAHFDDYYEVPRETLDGRNYDELGNPCTPFFPASVLAPKGVDNGKS